MALDGRATLAGIAVGAGAPIVVMGALNVSPESFYPGSVHETDGSLLRAACAMADAGADLIDVGARSSAPYLPTAIDATEERERLARAVELLAGKLAVPISGDTALAGPAGAALEAGARVINDVSGLRDATLAKLVALHGAGLILMASPGDDDDLVPTGAPPIEHVAARLRAGLVRAQTAGIPPERIVLDPGIGFFRNAAVAWDEWDADVLAHLDQLGRLGRPLGLAVSRKSFIGAITGRTSPADRLAGSLAATAIAVWNGAALIRTHDVPATVEAVRVAERLRAAGRA